MVSDDMRVYTVTPKQVLGKKKRKKNYARRSASYCAKGGKIMRAFRRLIAPKS